MAESIYIGDFAKGLKTDRVPFNIDNDSFPYLFNAYVWRGRAKKKRGTRYLGQLTVQYSTYSLGTVTASGAGTLILNIFSVLGISSQQPGANIVPGSSAVPIVITIGSQQLTDSTGTGVFVVTGSGNITSATVNYGIGYVYIVFSGAAGPLNVTATFNYYPGLPVMGERDFSNNSVNFQNFPNLLAFDTIYSYQCNQASANATFWNTTYFKSSGVAFEWSGQDYQQFWTINYPVTTPSQSGSLWATNNVPGLNILYGTYGGAGSGGTTITFNFKSGSLLGTNFTTLVAGDVIWFNEWGSGSTINGISGIVASGGTGGNYVVTFTSNQTVSGTGIVQMLTNTIPGQDGIKWYDGDPTRGTGIVTSPPALGWVNFAPPLTAFPATVSINETPAGSYYLVGALAIVSYKDRLIFFSPWIQTSSSPAIQLQDVALWSWNGTPYYSLPVPNNQTFVANAYYVNQTGLGGYLSASTSQPIFTVTNNEDVILVGFGGSGKKTRFVYTGNDLDPFLFFNINSELPSTATFSAVTLDKGAIDIGTYGLAMTDQQSSQRIDLDIPDTIFNVKNLNNGLLRINAIRDFFREWIYFTYPLNISPWNYPSHTLLFNYRDNTWGFLYENWTTHGYYRAYTKRTWLNTGYRTWNDWREPWNTGINSPLETQVIAGNPQGYVIVLSEGTSEAVTGTVNSIGTDGSGNLQITSYNHCVNSNIPTLDFPEYLYFTGGINTPYLNGVIGKVITVASGSPNTFSVDIPYPITATIIGVTQANPAVVTASNNYVIGQQVTISGIVGMTQLNGNTYTVTAATASTFTLNVNSTGFSTYVSGGTATPLPYMGLAKYIRLCQPYIQTKQFNFYWEEGRQTRLCSQKYLLDKTTDSEVTLDIFLSQDPYNAWNDPTLNEPPNSLIYSQTLYTCPESTNLGLTAANTNLQMPTAFTQEQIWHRMNTSLIGDSVQIGITLNDIQMRNFTDATAEVTLHGIQLTVERGPLLA